MKIDTTPSQVATSALQAIPFSTIIGSPLDACIKAQAMAAKTTWQFIQEVGMKKVDGKDDTKEAVNVAFTFIQNGNTVRLNIPLLSIIPIPYIAIQNIDISFKANLSAASSTAEERVSNDQFNTDITGGGLFGWGMWGVKMSLKGGYSSKKDSRATQDSKYSVEYTMDVDIRAGQENMPAGLAKVLEILNSSLNVCNPKGELGVNSNLFEVESDSGFSEQLIVTYKNPDGRYEPTRITVRDSSGEIKPSDADEDKILNAKSNSRIFRLEKTGIYTVVAGDLSETVEVKKIVNPANK
ncbi:MULTISPECIES: DUF2589 domain-containing protein [unclassified Bacteroides]|mgnify:FL=1|jgi:hypothetical protein|uniref:DUF2589 domain-containing protein n=1 Tax=unclassified Bacteroides TaxID=2646097 RepID=UPI000E8CF43B|nr:MULTISPECIES: DUF2589 domain-containing protein [unclassified Bacteroides]RGN44420.1 DUF2589 domain-containing protein [Bacteroides sp. OM05-12]RHR72074.1 DUF2589 domain-containing protein [Bacteroides sp. AF16-49]